MGEGVFTLEIEIIGALSVQHSSRYVGNIAASITLTSDIYVELLDSKCLLEVLEEADEVLGNFFLGFSSWSSHSVAGTDRLLHPVVESQKDLVSGWDEAYHSMLVMFTHEF